MMNAALRAQVRITRFNLGDERLSASSQGRSAKTNRLRARAERFIAGARPIDLGDESFAAESERISHGPSRPISAMNDPSPCRGLSEE